ncbi:MAG: response regulator [Nitrososphaera sp.]
MDFDSLSALGAKAKHAIGMETDDFLLKYIEENPGKSIYEMQKELEWSIGKIQGSVKRLSDNSKVVLTDAIQGGRRVTKVYSKNYKRSEPGIISIDNNLVTDFSQWGKTVEVYAYTRSSIIVSPQPNKQWDEISLFKTVTSPVYRDSEIVIKLPMQLINFYQLRNAEYDITGIGDAILITILSTIIEMTKFNPNNLSIKILWIDDDPTVRKGFTRDISNALKTLNIKAEIDELDNLSKINSIVINNDHDLIIIDPKLQHNVNGFKELVRLKKEKKLRAKIIGLSANPYDNEDIKEAKEIGAILLDKPTYKKPFLDYVKDNVLVTV